MSKSPVTTYHDVIKYFRCPGSYFNHGARMVIDAYRRYQEGILPYAGGLMEQPAKIVEAFETVRILDLEHANDVKKNGKKMKRGKNGRQSSKG